MSSSATSALSRALSYPYTRPLHSFLYPDVSALSASAGARHVGDGSRTAVLCIGSNAAPAQLARKFGPSPANPVPVLRVSIAGIDVVHAALVASYGAVPATIVGSPRTVVSAHVTMLNQPQLKRMNETETGYFLARMEKGVVRYEGAVVERECFAYVARYGALEKNGAFVALEELHGLSVENRRLEVIDQKMAQRIVIEVAVKRGVIDEVEEVETFIERNIENVVRRQKVIAALRDEWGRWEGFKVCGPWTIVTKLGK